MPATVLDLVDAYIDGDRLVLRCGEGDTFKIYDSARLDGDRLVFTNSQGVSDSVDRMAFLRLLKAHGQLDLLQRMLEEAK